MTSDTLSVAMDSTWRRQWSHRVYYKKCWKKTRFLANWAHPLLSRK